jgi:3-hydroxybutyrate dehydrogenase
VTGSLSGIGLGIAHSLAKRGYNIILNGFASDDEIKRTIADFNSKYPNTEPVFIYADLTKREDCKKIVEETLKRFQRIDVLVNNAGMQHIDEAINFPDEKWETVLALNLSSAFYLSKYALPGMQKAGWGRIINIASVHGLVASVNKSAYVAAKHGIVGLTKALALENAKKGITVNAICPGWVFTPLIKKQIDIIAEREKISFEAASQKLVSEKQPSGEFSHPEDIGEIVAFLVTENAKQVNGASWTIDGGWTAQ